MDNVNNSKVKYYCGENYSTSNHNNSVETSENPCCDKYSVDCLNKQRIRAAAKKSWLKYNPERYGGYIVKIEIDGKPFDLIEKGSALMPKQRKISEKQPFRILSVTKTFTVTLLLIMVDNCKLSLDDKLERWFPQFRYADRITLRMLANMTSGIDDPTNDPNLDYLFFEDPFKQWQTSEIIQLAAEMDPRFFPGTDYFYSNTNTIIIGDILEMVNGEALHCLIQKYILTPLRLKDTFLPPIDKLGILPNTNIHGYIRTNDSIVETTYWNTSYSYGSGAMISTQKDMVRWARYLGTGRLLSKRMFEERIAPTSVGLGDNTPEKYYGLGIIYDHGWLLHAGAEAGMLNVVSYLPHRKTSVSIVLNYDSLDDLVVPINDMWNAVVNALYPNNSVTDLPPLN